MYEIARLVKIKKNIRLNRGLEVKAQIRFPRNINIKIPVNTVTLTSQVEPYRRESETTLLVSTRKKPAPMKK